MPVTARHLVPAVINSTNLNGAAAVFLSLGLGSIAGAFVFGLAVLIGTINKYNSLRRVERGLSAPAHPLRVAIEHPTFTAVALMVAAGLNCLDAIWHLFTAPEDMRLYYTMTTLAWGFGVFGDNALRMNDHTNFAGAVDHHYTPGFIGMIAIAARNPGFYYLFCNMFMANATMLRNVGPLDNLQMMLSFFVAVLSLGGILYGLYKSWRVADQHRAATDINDGVVNYANAIGCVAIAAIALLAGNHYVLAAQGLFTFSNIKALFETRRALKKEGATPLS